MPTARGRLSAVVGPGGCIYVVGGEDDTARAVATVEVYSPSTNSWTTVAPMPTARELLGLTAGPDGRIYAIGGTREFTDFQKAALMDNVEVYTPGNDTWTIAPSMPTARFLLRAVTGHDGRIYAMGGYNGDILSTVEVYNPGDGSWTIGPSMPTERDAHGAVTGADGRIYVIGGESKAPGFLSTADVYTP
jgi:N-acetylneuraminic acid mutarotase